MKEERPGQDEKGGREREMHLVEMENDRFADRANDTEPIYGESECRSSAPRGSRNGTRTWCELCSGTSKVISIIRERCYRTETPFLQSRLNVALY